MESNSNGTQPPLGGNLGTHCLQFLGSDGGGKGDNSSIFLTSTWVEFQIVLSLKEKKYVFKKQFENLASVIKQIT